MPERLPYPQWVQQGLIDGIVALIMALGRATTQPPPFVSVYQSRGVITI